MAHFKSLCPGSLSTPQPRRLSVYNAQRHWLDIEYTGGGRYRYFSVPAEVHLELLAADSIGTYINQCIKPYYRYTRLPSGRI